MPSKVVAFNYGGWIGFGGGYGAFGCQIGNNALVLDPDCGMEPEQAVYDIFANGGGTDARRHNILIPTEGIKTSVSAGDDTCQMVMIHVHSAIAGLVTSNCGICILDWRT